MSFLNKSISGLIWNHFSKVADFGLAYLLSIIVARMMGIHEYSVYVATMSIASFMLLIVSGGFDEVLTKYVPYYTGLNKQGYIIYLVKVIFCLRLSILGIVSIVVYFTRIKISIFFNNSNIVEYIFLILLYIIIQSLVNFFTNLLIAQYKTKKVFIINTISRLLNIAFAIILLNKGYGLQEVLVQFIIVSFTTLLIYFLLSPRFISGKNEKFKLSHIFNFSYAMIINSILGIVLGKYTSILLLNHHLGSSVEIAYFEIAYSLEVIIEYIFALGFYGIGLSITSELATHGVSKLKSARTLVIQYYQLFVFPLSIFCIVFAEEIITLLYSSQYKSVTSVFRTFLSINFLAVTLFARDFNATILFSIGKERKVLLLRFLLGLLTVVTNYLFIPTYGAIGAIGILGLSFLIITIFEYFMVSHHIGFGYDFLFAAKVIFVSIFSILVVYIFSSFIHSVLIDSLLYLILIIVGYFLLKIHKSEIINIFLRKFNISNVN